jgi:hypothetical protein
MGGIQTDDGETEIRGNPLDGPEQDRAVDHAAYKKARNPDAVVRVDDEKDDLYSDGIEVDDDLPTQGTDGDGQSR